MPHPTRLALIAALVALSSPLPSHAYNFVPSEMEWATWPEYCRARYVTTNIGDASKWASQYPRAAVEMWRRQLGQDTFLDIHHYCAGLAYLNRSKFEGNQERRRMVLSNALSEATYTYGRIPQSSPVYSDVVIALAQIKKALGNTDEAIEFAKQAVTAKPKDPKAHLGLALLYRDLKRFDLARDALLEGDRNLEGESVEIHYTLGLLYFELKDLDNSLLYARKAYEKQYPLPGLREKLVRAGRWTE